MNVNNYRAVLFDLDGVLTPTAEMHQRAWAEMFSAYLAKKDVTPYRPQDYFTYLDGRRRDEGIAALLKSRNLSLPHGDADDTANDETIVGLGVRKNDMFLDLLFDGIDPYPGSIAFLDSLTPASEGGPQLAVVSSSKNAGPVLEAAGIADRFPLLVDGLVAQELGLPGKPAPDTFCYAADQLELKPEECVVVEDAISGVQAAAAGKFAAVIGVNRGAGREEMLAAGATIVVNDLQELV
ncbi:HAD family hydrolase [Corynebacterium ulceribovis]|uniref:HAD family hydrolase n=1 Tax=Corynebacterium ulceribovis TaxID=487732 RepID=UPI00036495DD|nr:HAD-IA family hydrolase [Corynebacterium ulceribovis]